VTQIIGNEELPNNGTVYKFEGYLYGDASVSFFLSDTAPGKGPDLYKHPYDEVFVVQEGELTFTVGSDTIEATSGQIVIAPARGRLQHRVGRCPFATAGDQQECSSGGLRYRLDSATAS
jgi:mannose-6-phosphate isomerase-like protein (cupin superfamily)